FNYSFLKSYHLTANVNNIFNAKYFTRRINMYPGPGILPADGRTFNIGFGVKI
ncbi:MAG: TonB-dependent receptor, partial [Mucilaginibacter sp.]|nr:TonB-dependent receptor [Mucilaginibacter sp.]